MAARAFCVPHNEGRRAAGSGLLRAACSAVGLVALAACGPSQAYCQQSYWERAATGAAGNPMMFGPSLVVSGVMELTCDRDGTHQVATPQVAAPSQPVQPQSAPSGPAETTAAEAAPTAGSSGADCTWNAQEYHYECW